MANYYKAFTTLLDGFLQQENRVTGVLDKVEKTINVKKTYQVQGN